jgi:hypothetical protein
MDPIESTDSKSRMLDALLIVDLFLSDRTFLAGNFASESDHFLYEAIRPWYVHSTNVECDISPIF